MCSAAPFQSLWIFSLINYKKPTYHNGHYEYPDWAHALGWTIAAISLVCIPGYAIINIVRAEGETFLEKFRNSIQPNIYTCKICLEHHCEHDFPDEHSVQEMTPIIQSTPVPILMRSPQQTRANLGAGRRPQLVNEPLKPTQEDDDGDE